RGGAARRRAGELDAVARLGARCRARRGRRDDGRSQPERPAAAEHDGRRPDLRVRGRGARRAREPRRRGCRRAADRRDAEPARQLRELGDAAAAVACCVRLDADRAPRQTVRVVRAYAGASRMKVRGLIISAAAITIALIPFVLSDYHRSQGADVAVYAMAILGLNVVTGYTGQISIGHGAFMALGGYTTAILTHNHGWNDIATLPIALLVGFAAGVVVGVPALRFHGAYLALLTFAFALAVPQIAKNYSHFTGGTEGLALPTHTGLWLYGVGWACVAVIYVLTWLLL